MKVKRVGEIIRSKRIEKRMSQSDLAEKLGCDASSVHKWERGKMSPSLKALTKLEKILQVGLLTKKFMKEAGGK